MNHNKATILARLCYTEQVYARINKKLGSHYSQEACRNLLHEILTETEETDFRPKGKNIYASNLQRGIRITINANNCRVITVDRLK